MRFVWKLVRRQISWSQLIGFFFANLFGTVIILLGVQFYKDVLPVFTEGDSFIKKDYIIVTKKVSTLGSLTGKSNVFTEKEIKEIEKQGFVKDVGAFQPSLFSVSAGIGVESAGIRLSTDMFFESVPDKYVDVNLDKWKYVEGSHEIPIIIPRNYLDLYNFGYAQARSLPKLSEGLMGMIQLDIVLRGNGKLEQYKGNIVGFSNRLNTILVPEKFMKQANREFAPNRSKGVSRLIVEVDNPADENITEFFLKNGYETADNKLDAGKTAYFLRLIIGIVLAVGLFISVLSFYILMLSIYLLIQKNSAKLENLMLMGYTPTKVALPYQLLAISLNFLVVSLSIIIVAWIRGYYLKTVMLLFPQLQVGGWGPALVTGVLLFILVSLVNSWIVKKKILFIGIHKR